MRLLLLLLVAAAVLLPAPMPPARAGTAGRPNLLWIIVDDMSANFSCYGEKTVQTPNVDRLAREGVRFTRAYVTAPVCSPCRSALITGRYQTSIGAHHHRSGRGREKIHLPTGVEPIPRLLQRAGYYTCIGSGVAGNARLGKTDYNFEWDPAIYDGADWSGRRPGQPFFMQVQLAGGKHRDGAGWQRLQREFGEGCTRPESVTLPPYYPRDPALLRDWAFYLDSVRKTDQEVGAVLDRLRAEGLEQSTLVVFMTDHGISHARGKQFLYDEGTHVPLIVRWPGRQTAGTVRTDLVEHIDLAAFTLAAGGVSVPAGMHGRDILAAGYRPREAVFAARDRCDETVDRIRSVRTERWLYIRNYHPRRPHLQPNRYKDNKPTLRRLRELEAARTLDPLARRLLFAPTRPAEELYDTTADPHQLTNLAEREEHAGTLRRLRERLEQWERETGDHGRTPETESRYDSDMAVYLGQRPDPVLSANIALMKQWAREGR